MVTATSIKTPLLVLPSQQGGDMRFMNVEHHRTVIKISKPGRDHRYVGSSHAWLILLNQDADPYLWNPFSAACIQLPGKETFPHLVSVTKTQGDHGYLFLVNYKSSNYSYWNSLKELQQSLVTKVILSSDPVNSSNNCAVIAIYGFESKVALFKVRGERFSWVDIGAKPATDIITCSSSNQLLSLCHDGNIQVWSLNSTCNKIKEIQPCFPENYFKPVLSGLYSTRSYLVESRGEILRVDRFVGEYVNDNDELVYEGYLLDGETNHPLVCPYKTLKFRVHKLDFSTNGWVEVESIGNGALFVGGNQSVWLPRAKEDQEWKENSIYFTDDYWERMAEDYLYGGHDLGVFGIEDKSVKQFYPWDDESERIDPPPIWIFPGDRSE